MNSWNSSRLMKIKNLLSSLEKNSKRESIKSSSSAMMLYRALKKYNHHNVHLVFLVQVLWASLGLCQNKEALSFQATDLAARVGSLSPTQDKLVISKPQFCKVSLTNILPQTNNQPTRPVEWTTLWSTTWPKCLQTQNKSWACTKRRALRRFA